MREPWGHPKGTEKDDYEPISEHFMAVDEGKDEVLGGFLIETVENRAREHAYKTLGAMSRVTATAYFEKYGYRIAGIPAPHIGTIHVVWMEKELKV